MEAEEHIGHRQSGGNKKQRDCRFFGGSWFFRRGLLVELHIPCILCGVLLPAEAMEESTSVSPVFIFECVGNSNVARFCG